MKMADLENFPHQGLHLRDGDTPALAADPLRSHHEYAQPGAADVSEAGEIEHDRDAAVECRCVSAFMWSM